MLSFSFGGRAGAALRFGSGANQNDTAPTPQHCCSENSKIARLKNTGTVPFFKQEGARCKTSFYMVCSILLLEFF
jgi:hypothetical protein